MPPESKPTRETVAKSGAWAAAAVFGGEFIFFAVFIVISRILGPHDIGVVALAGLFAELLSLVALLGIPQAVVQTTAFSRATADTAFWLVQAAALGSSLLAYLCADSVAAWFGVPEVGAALEVLALLPSLVAFGAVHEARLMREFRFRSLTYRTLAANGLAGAVGLTMAFNGFGMWSLVAQRLVLSGVVSLWSWAACRWVPGSAVSLGEARSLTVFGRSVLIGQVAWPLNLRLYDVILGHALGPSAVGWFRLAMRCFEFLVRSLSLPLVRIGLPLLARMTDDPRAFREVFYRQLKLAVLVAAPVFCGAALLADDLFVAVFGDRWQPSVDLFRILCLAGLAMIFERLGWTALTAIGRPEWAARAHFLLLPVAALAAWFSSGYGLEPVAWTFVLRAALVIPLVTLLLWKLGAIGFGPWLGQISRVVIATALVTGLAAAEQTLLLGNFGLVASTLSIVFSSLLLYVALVRVIAPQQFQEAVEVLSLIRQRQAEQKYPAARS